MKKFFDNGSTVKYQLIITNNPTEMELNEEKERRSPVLNLFDIAQFAQFNKIEKILTDI